MPSVDRPSALWATRLTFFAPGFGLACWAPLVPYAKERLSVGEATLGLLLLCAGIGSLSAMVLTGALAPRIGSKPFVVLGGLALAAMLPLLTTAPTPALLGASLFVFGAAFGSLAVAGNIQAVEMERIASKPMMSGLHALWSVGGFSGSGVTALLLTIGATPARGATVAAAVVAVATLIAWPSLLRTNAGDKPDLVLPRGMVLILAALSAILFLVEGTLLDWSALLITEAGLVDVTRAGLGYMCFAIAMTVGRLSGDELVIRFGDRRVLRWSGCVAVAGFAALLTAGSAAWAMLGFVLIGLGVANIVPLLFRAAGRQKQMPHDQAIAAVSTIAYAATLFGPATIGLLAHAVGLDVAFWMLAALLCLIPIFAGKATSRER